ncbi:MAG: hypothetical protein FWG39_02995 [Alphaproteobacteria bacterium]|nr:hypothetical protein [Alphaproteobacteria bacterium]
MKKLLLLLPILLCACTNAHKPTPICDPIQESQYQLWNFRYCNRSDLNDIEQIIYIKCMSSVRQADYKLPERNKWNEDVYDESKEPHYDTCRCTARLFIEKADDTEIKLVLSGKARFDGTVFKPFRPDWGKTIWAPAYDRCTNHISGGSRPQSMDVFITNF